MCFPFSRNYQGSVDFNIVNANRPIFMDVFHDTSYRYGFMMRECLSTALSRDVLGYKSPPPQDVPQALPLGHLSGLAKLLGHWGC